MNYDDLKTAVFAYADRGDNTTVTMFDIFINMFESRINRLLKVRSMSARATHVVIQDQEYYSLPVDYAGIRDIEIYTPGSSTRETLTRLNPEQMNSLTISNNTFYTIIADQFQIKPIANLVDKVIEIVYYQRLEPLTSGNTNWLARDYPDCYLSGVMVELSSYLKDLESVSLWQQRLAEVVKEIDINDNQEQWAGSTMITQIG